MICRIAKRAFSPITKATFRMRYAIIFVADVLPRVIIISIIIIIKDIYTAQVRKGRKCDMSAEMAVWLRNCLV